MSDTNRPTSRSRDLVVQSLPNETLVYDLNLHQAHCLNETSSFIWNRCDGKLSIDEIRALAAAEFGHPVSTDLVELALMQLNERELMEVSGLGDRQIDRRSVLKKIGLATAIALPVVASLIAPPNAFSIAANCTCTSNASCLGRACPSTTNCNNLGLCAP